MSHHGSDGSGDAHHFEEDHYPHHDRHDSYYEDHIRDDDGYYEEKDARNETRSQSDPAKSHRDTIRKVALAVGIAGVVVGAMHLWKQKQAADRERDHHAKKRQRRDFTRAKEARRRKEEAEEDEESGAEKDHGRASEPRRIAYAPSDASRPRSRAKDSRRWDDRDDRRNGPPRDRERQRDHGDYR